MEKQNPGMRRAIQNPSRFKALKVREIMEEEVFRFFKTQGFRHVVTPQWVSCPGMEPHIRPVGISQGGYLHTSPEFAMKKLLTGGLEKIFQLAPVFRDEPVSATHLKEFTMIEWYRAHAGYEEIMKDVENLFFTLAEKVSGTSAIQYQGQKINLASPWPRLQVRELFLEHTKVDLLKCREGQDIREEAKRLGLQLLGAKEKTWDDYYFEIWLNCIEPKLPKDKPCIVYRYPESQAALSMIEQDADGSRWARRFEVYAGGLELGNAFEELTDSIEQRARFKKDMDLRERVYGASFPRTEPDEEFLAALAEGMPPSSGIAMGFERMVMLLADQADIRMTRWMV